MDAERLIIDFKEISSLSKDQFINFLYNILEKEQFAKTFKQMLYEIVFINAENFILNNIDIFNCGINLIREYIKKGRKISIQLNIEKEEVLNIFNKLSLTQLNVFNINKDWDNWLIENNCCVINRNKNNIYAISANIGLINIFLTEERNYNLPSKPLHKFINSINNKPNKELIIRPM